ncbi:hypothetical protein Tco_1561903 [Tanacetum coccineum]
MVKITFCYHFTEEPEKEGGDPSKEGERGDQEKDVDVNSTNSVYTVSSPVNTVSSPVNAVDLPDDPNMPPLEDIVYSDDDEDRFTEVKTASAPIETQKPLLKDEDVCACARYQVNPKVLHLHAVKRIFRYLKGQPKLGLWYPKDSPFDLVAYTDSDYAGARLDRTSTIGGCQFLGSRLISWQCKKQTVVANSTTEAEYVAASSCCGQVLWIQNQLLDYGIRVNDGDSKLMLLGITYYCWVKVNAVEDGKKIIITESIVRRDLQLEDAEGVDCLPNSTIFEQLTLISSKTTTWNEFSSTMTSAIIYLATNQKFNFQNTILKFGILQAGGDIMKIWPKISKDDDLLKKNKIIEDIFNV